jgi:hypothetical protein
MKEYKVYTNHRGYVHLQDDLNDQAVGGWRLIHLHTTERGTPEYSVWERDVLITTESSDPELAAWKM